jgi:hypothetical protein
MDVRMMIRPKGGVLALLVVTVLLGCGRKKPTGCLTPSDSAQCFVEDFYKWYTLPTARGGPAGNAREAMNLRRDAFSPAVLSALASDTNAVRLDFDPFIHAKSPCARYVTGKVDVAGARTRVAIHCMAQYREPRPAVIAEVFQAGTAFQFTNFLYADSLTPPYSDVFTALAELPADRAVKSAPDIVGTWRGTSICVDKVNLPVCNDEDALYEIRQAGRSGDSVIVRAQKMVNGATELVSQDAFTHQSDGSWATDIVTTGARLHVSLRLSGDSLIGDVTDVSTSRKQRDIALRRDHPK